MLSHGWWWDTAREILQLVGAYRNKLGELHVSTKSDETLLTEADIAVQEMIIQKIREVDTDSRIVAEEDGRDAAGYGATDSTTVWIVDPIDGTSQFVQPAAVEFCTVIARYSEGHPCAALVVAPELGMHRAPIVIMSSIEDGLLMVNREPYELVTRELTGRASTTRSRNSIPSDLEKALLARHYDLKTRTTSQTIDMVRTALDLSAIAPDVQPFDLFHRRQQKLWDGAAGICLAIAAGLTVGDENGDRLLPLASSLLMSAPHVLPSSVIGHRDLVQDILGVHGVRRTPHNG